MDSNPYRYYKVEHVHLACFLFIECVGSTANLASLALQRLKQGFRPAPITAYSRMFRDFLAFLQAAALDISQVNTIILLAFMEFLVANHLSQSNISNHLAAIRAMFIVHGLSTLPFQDERISLFIKSLKINAHLQPRVSKLISIEVLNQIIDACNHLRDPILFKALYLFMFYSFLRISNVLPHSAKSFDPTRHLTRGDLIFSKNGCTIIVKWSKTLQDRKETKTIVIPQLGNSPLCPITALKAMYALYPGSKNDPLFIVSKSSPVVPLSDSTARKHLQKVSSSLHINPSLTFHTFRRSGTTWAFQNGVHIQDIMAHGTWSSDTVWRYIKSIPSSSTPVSRAFSTSLFL